jgi:hypothetical protein
LPCTDDLHKDVGKRACDIPSPVVTLKTLKVADVADVITFTRLFMVLVLHLLAR